MMMAGARAPPELLRCDCDSDAALFEAGRLAAQTAHIIEILAPDDRVAHNLDLIDARRIHQKRPLDADAMRDAPDSKRAVQSLAMMADDDTLEDLDALARTLNHFDMHADRVTRGNFWHISAQ